MNKLPIIIIALLIIVIIAQYCNTRYKANKIETERQKKMLFLNEILEKITSALTLLKSPLDELDYNETIHESEEKNIQLAKKQVNNLITLVNELFHAGRQSDEKKLTPSTAIQEIPIHPYKKIHRDIMKGYGVEGAHHILIVEDDPEMSAYLQKQLTGDYFVYLANNGDEGWDILTLVNIDLVIAESELPKTKGDELCAMIKSNLPTSHIPVVLITPQNDKPDILKGFAIGADNYLTKPFDATMLQVIVSTILSNRDRLKQRFSSYNLEKKNENIEGLSTIDTQFMDEVKTFIENNMNNATFTVDTVCAHVGMSRSSFYSKIKAMTNQPPADYVRCVRLNKAAELLKTRKYNINEVADLTGFNNVKYFREVFKKYYNMTPSAFTESGQLKTN